jgi:two-component system sensor histidine kinase PilS (NtrC family)
LAGSNETTRNIRSGLPQLPDSYWRSLRYFSIYRLIVAGVFFFAATVYGGTADLGYEDIRLFRLISGTYLLAGAGLLWVVIRMRGAFNVQLTVQVSIDLLALTLLMYAGGGAKSGIGVMMFVVLAGAGLVGQGRMTLFYAALATLAVLGEESYRLLQHADDPAGFFRTGLTSIGFFGTAIAARLLARRIVANETLAWQRGVELANQLQINRRVIRDMQDGVLVVDAAGRVRQRNPQAEMLLDVHPGENDDLASYSIALAERFKTWIASPAETETQFRVAGTPRTLRARLLPPNEGENALIYLEDMGRVQEQAQQLKLAALGRLTANMAHEIRNPLSAISHAAELLVDEKRGEGQERLIRIIGDNTRRLNQLVAEVLELGRRDRAHVESVRLGLYLRQFIDDFAVRDPAVHERVTVAVDGEPVFTFDRAHLHRILWNLVTNALRHCSQAAGAVRLSGRCTAGGKVEIHIVDDGPGIGESLRGQVFEPFFTTHGTGTGLGLYIARELCEANGALLELLDNSPGAHFAITAKGVQ